MIRCIKPLQSASLKSRYQIFLSTTRSLKTLKCSHLWLKSLCRRKKQPKVLLHRKYILTHIETSVVDEVSELQMFNLIKNDEVQANELKAMATQNSITKAIGTVKKCSSGWLECKVDWLNFMLLVSNACICHSLTNIEGDTKSFILMIFFSGPL